MPRSDGMMLALRGSWERKDSEIDTTTRNNNELRSLYMTTRKLSGIKCNQNHPIRSEDGTLLTKMGDQLQRWKRHFESVLKRPAPSQLPDPRPADVALNINTGPISRGEISTALTQLKNAKAPGVNNIPTEALKEGGPCTVEALHRT